MPVLPERLSEPSAMLLMGRKVKTWLYGILSVLLLFTAAIVSNIEALQQTLNVTLDTAYVHVFIPVEALIWVRSFAIVLLIVAHAMRHVQLAKPQTAAQPQPAQPAPLELNTLLPTLPYASIERIDTIASLHQYQIIDATFRRKIRLFLR